MCVKVTLCVLLLILTDGYCLNPISVISENQTITLPISTSDIEGTQRIDFLDITSNNTVKPKCEGRCKIDQNNYTMQSCEVREYKYTDNNTNEIQNKTINNKKYNIEVHIKPTLNNETTQWACTVNLDIVKTNENANDGPQIVNRNFQLTIKFPNEKTPGANSMLNHVITHCVLSLIIFGLIIYICYYRCKDKTSISPTDWTAKSEPLDNTVRYTKMPTQSSSKASQQASERESCIYEALDNVRGNNIKPGLSAPALPSLDTLPRSTSTSHITSLDASTPISSMQRCLINDSNDNGCFKGGKGKKTESKKVKDSGTFDRYIKERPPLPLPPSHEEVYEEMDSDQKTTPFLNRKLPATPQDTSNATPRFDRKPPNPVFKAKKPPIPTNITPYQPSVNKVQPIKPIMQVPPSQIIEAALLKKQNWQGSQNLKPNYLPPQNEPPNSNPNYLPHQNETQHLKPNYLPPQNEPQHLKPNYLPPQNEPSPFNMRRAMFGAPGDALRPPPPSKPKQHFQPRSPVAPPARLRYNKPPLPVPIHISTEHATDSDDEEWVYEDLHKYDKYNENFYSQ